MSMVAVVTYIPTGSVESSLFSLYPQRLLFCFIFSLDNSPSDLVRWDLNVVLATNTEHIFFYSLAIYISFFKKHTFNSFIHILTGLLGVLVLSF